MVGGKKTLKNVNMNTMVKQFVITVVIIIENYVHLREEKTTLFTTVLKC